MIGPSSWFNGELYRWLAVGLLLMWYQVYGMSPYYSRPNGIYLSAWVLALHWAIGWARKLPSENQLGKFGPLLEPCLWAIGIGGLGLFTQVYNQAVIVFALLSSGALSMFLWTVGLSSLKLPKVGIWLRRLLWPFGLLLVILIFQGLHVEQNALSWKPVRVCLVTMAHFALILLLLSDKGYPKLAKLVAHPLGMIILTGAYFYFLRSGLEVQKFRQRFFFSSNLIAGLLLLVAVGWMWHSRRIRIWKVSLREIGTTFGLLGLAVFVHEMVIPWDGTSRMHYLPYVSLAYVFANVVLLTWRQLTPGIRLMRTLLQLFYLFVFLSYTLAELDAPFALFGGLNFYVAVAVLLTMAFVHYGSAPAAPPASQRPRSGA